MLYVNRLHSFQKQERVGHPARPYDRGYDCPALRAEDWLVHESSWVPHSSHLLARAGFCWLREMPHPTRRRLNGAPEVWEDQVLERATRQRGRSTSCRRSEPGALGSRPSFGRYSGQRKIQYGRNQIQTFPGAECSDPRLAQQKDEPGAPGLGSTSKPQNTRGSIGARCRLPTRREIW